MSGWSPARLGSSGAVGGLLGAAAGDLRPGPVVLLWISLAGWSFFLVDGWSGSPSGSLSSWHVVLRAGDAQTLVLMPPLCFGDLLVAGVETSYVLLLARWFTPGGCGVLLVSICATLL